MMSIASSTGVVHKNVWENTLSTTNINGHLGWRDQVDTQGTAGRIALNYQNAAENSLGAAVSGLEGLVGTVGQSNNVYDINKNKSFQDYTDQLGSSKATLQGVQSASTGIADEYAKIAAASNGKFDNVIGSLGSINTQMGGIIDNINSMRGNFQPVYTRLNGIDDDLSAISRDIGNFIPQYANKLNGMGDSLWQSGSSLLDMGGLFNDQARQLMAMDGSGGGLIGAYIDSLNSIDPDKYVSMAASDVQRQYQNAQNQQDRQLARSGVDAGSARSVALQQQYAQAMAAASAGAKFRARLQGQNERLAAVNQAVNTANALAQTGTQISTAGAGVQAQGAGIIGNAGQLQLGGSQAQANIAQSQIGVQNAWLSALNGELQTQDAAIKGLGAQADVQKQMAAVEAQKVDTAKSSAEMGLKAQGVVADTEKGILDAQQKNAQLEADVNSKAWQTSQGQQVEAAKALANARIEAGKYYTQEAAEWGKLAGSGGLMSALGY